MFQDIIYERFLFLILFSSCFKIFFWDFKTFFGDGDARFFMSQDIIYLFFLFQDIIYGRFLFFLFQDIIYLFFLFSRHHLRKIPHLPFLLVFKTSFTEDSFFYFSSWLKTFFGDGDARFGFYVHVCAKQHTRGSSHRQGAADVYLFLWRCTAAVVCPVTMDPRCPLSSLHTLC